MTHERAMQLILDSLVQPLADAEAQELEAHLRACPSCTVELAEYRELWEDLAWIDADGLEPRPGAMGGEEALDAAVDPRVARLRETIRRVREEESGGMDETRPLRGEGEPAPPRSGTRSPVLRAAAAILLVAGGVLIGRSLPQAGSDGIAPTDGGATDTVVGDQFLFLVRDTDLDPEADARREEEFMAWVTDLQNGDRLVDGAPLDPVSWAGPTAGLPNDGTDPPIHGFMIVRATDMAEARRIALTSPNRAFGGGIEVLRLDNR